MRRRAALVVVLGGGLFFFLVLRRRRGLWHRAAVAPGTLRAGSGPVLCSVDDGRHAPTEVRFVLEGGEGAVPPGGLLLCWVTPDGGLEHHYEFCGAHDEQTFTGDALVVLRRRGSLPKSLRDITEDDLVCCYRPEDPLDEFRQHEVCIRLLPSRVEATVMATPRRDDELRVIVRHPDRHYLPPADQDWRVEYVYYCPPLPRADGYNSRDHTFYVWGDMDFDDYGAGSEGRAGDLDPEDKARVEGLHPCTMNQIVPQLMTGRCLASNNRAYIPFWREFDHWVIQAQYFWCNEDGEDLGARAFCGPVVPVEPGDRVHTTIDYHASSGKIEVCIFVEDESPEHRIVQNKLSRIVIDRPFPHNGSLFKSWRDFFERCEAVERSLPGASTSTGPLGRPGLSVEYKGRVSVEALRSICPFEVVLASFPGCTKRTSEWRTELFCPRLGHVAFFDEAEGCLHLEEAVKLAGRPGRVMMDRIGAGSSRKRGGLRR